MPTIQINMNGASNSIQGLEGAGYVLRDHHGEWLAGSEHNLKITTSAIAEL